jgi:O-antigen biosynthesis protein
MSKSDTLLKQMRANAARSAFYRKDVEVSVAPVDPKVRLIAWYLPQFHPIPENDLWWGKGFTEWTNVSRAVPQFVGHYQPRLPGELGFYDLRIPQTLHRQAELAMKYGIHGFCLHYYWFAGRTLLDAPLKLLLSHPEIPLNFCICWANENWTRSWDGLKDDILLAQQHSPEDDVAFARALEPVLHDPRYIRIDGRPLLVVYRPGLLPDPVATARRWRQHFARAGLGNPFLVMAQCFGDEDPRFFGFDAAVEFPPHKLSSHAPRLNAKVEIFDPAYDGTIHDYDYIMERAAAQKTVPYRLFPGVTPAWDNEARKPGRGVTFAGSTPTKYGVWLEQACRRAVNELRPAERFVFINAWNEWAEGAYLEPDRHFGYAYLHETAKALGDLDMRRETASGTFSLVVVVHDACMGGAQILALRLIELCVQQFGVRIHVSLGAGGVLEEAFRELAPTELFDGFADMRAWRSAADGLARQGFTAALFNSVACGQAIEPLRASGLRCVALVNELPSLMRQYNLAQAATIVARQADAAVFPATFVRDKFAEYVGPITVQSVIRPQGLFRTPAQQSDLPRLRETARHQLGIPIEAWVVLGVANGDLRKGVDLWPAFARGVLARHPDTYFVWIGGIEPELHLWLRHDMASIGYADRLVTPGSVDDLKPIYAMADVFVLSSREDPFPSVMLDAMAHGLPLVAFEDSGGVTDVVRMGGGVAVPYLDMQAMANAICRLLDSPQEREAIANAGRETIARDFDFSDYGFDLLRLASPALRKVSVVVPNYNYAGYLKQRLGSIWSQTYPVFEVIVLDDASTDESTAVIADLQRQSGRRIRLVRNDVNSGSISHQWARGVDLARGDLTWIAEADDFADPGFLAAVVPSFEDPETVLSYCQSRQVTEEGVVLADDYIGYVMDIDPLRWRQNYHGSGTAEIEDALSVKNTIPNVSAVVFRRDALAEVLRSHIDEMTKLRNAADWLCYLRLMTKGAVSFIAASLNNHRRHERSTTLSTSDRQHLDEIIMMQELSRTLATISPERQAAARRWRDEVARQFGIRVDALVPQDAPEIG